MNNFLKIFERFIVIVLILIMVVIISLAVLDLGSAIIRYILTTSFSSLDLTGLLDVLGLVLLILIGIELLETVKAYLSEGIVHVEIVLEVALIAIARKVILLDYTEYSGLTILSIAALVLALSVGYYLEKRARSMGSHFENRTEERVSSSGNFEESS